MRLETGTTATPIRLVGLDGETFDTRTLVGKRHLLAFFRFAACPFCNLRVAELVRRREELGEDFEIVAIFDSPLENLRRYTEKHEAPFPILADEVGEAAADYAIEHSVGGFLKGMVMRAPTLMKGMASGYLPTRFQGSLTTMPAEFLVDEAGVIHTAYYATDEGDHLPFELIRAYATGQAPSEARPDPVAESA